LKKSEVQLLNLFQFSFKGLF